MAMVTCSWCDRTFDAARWRRGNAFCSNEHRVAYHRHQRKTTKFLSAIQALGIETGLIHVMDSEDTPAHVRLKYLGENAIFEALRHLGYAYKDGAWVKRGFAAMFDGKGD